MGLAWQRLPAECAADFEGRGIYYGAASTEALNCRDQVVYIVGAGNSAGQAAMHLVDYASKVVMVVRGRELGDRMSQYLVKRIRECTDHGQCIEVLTRTEVVGCRGRDRLEGLTLKNLETGALTQVESSFLFVFIGAAPRTDWLGDQVVERLARLHRDRPGSRSRQRPEGLAARAAAVPARGQRPRRVCGGRRPSRIGQARGIGGGRRIGRGDVHPPLSGVALMGRPDFARRDADGVTL